MKSYMGTVGFLILCFSTFTTSQASAKPASYDAKFLDQMSEHHQDAIKMAEMAESKAQNPEVKKVALRMAKDQKEEIAQMKNWREKFFNSAPKTKMTMPKMDMSTFKEKSGRDFDLAFLDMMAKHHEQGIEMAKSASDKLFNPQIKTFAQTVMLKQDSERSELQNMKKSEASQSGTQHE